MGSPASWTHLENLQRKVDPQRKLSNQIPDLPKLAPLNMKEQKVYSKLPLDPATQQRKLISASSISVLILSVTKLGVRT